MPWESRNFAAGIIDQVEQVTDDYLRNITPGVAPGAAKLVQQADFYAKDNRDRVPDCHAGSDGGSQTRRHCHL
jgi:hypothetical protein